MSTRSTTHFQLGGKTQAIIYRHPDGYPEGHGRFLLEFFADINANLTDKRFGDPTYLAAKLVVALAREFNVGYEYGPDGAKRVMKDHPLDFISVGVMMDDPGDIEFRYVVQCDQSIPDLFGDDRPKVWVEERTGPWDEMNFEIIGELGAVVSEAENAEPVS